MKTCSKCSKTAVTYIRYNGTHLCKDHFLQYLEKRVKKEIKKQGKTPPNTRFGIAVSGGKDSLVALHLMNKIFGKRKQVELIAMTVDEGIEGYRNKSINIAQKNCRILDIEHYVASFTNEIGLKLDEIMKRKTDSLGACGYCGVFRRFCLNTLAKKLSIDKVVTGHNLDDMAQSILMNFVNADSEKLARLGPHKKIQPGLIPRMLPLRSIPEKENALYAILKEIEYHDGTCPYSEEAFRGLFRDVILELEEHNPGTRHSILKSYDNIKEALIQTYPPVSLEKCNNCGEPTTRKLCKTCVLKKRLGLE